MNGILHYYKNSNLRSKLFISYMVVVIIPLIVLGVYSYFQSRTFLLNQADQVLNDNLKKLTENLNYKFKQYSTTIETICFNQFIVQAFNTDYSDYTTYFALYSDLKYKIEPLFDTFLILNEEIKSVTIYTESNIPDRGSNVLSARYVEDQEWYKKTLETNKTKWYFLNGKLFGAREMLSMYKSDIINIVRLDLNYSKVFESIEGTESGEYGIIICDADHRALYSHHKFKDSSYVVNESELISRKGKNVRINGINYIVMYKDIEIPGWTVYYYTPVNMISIDARSIVNATAIIISICFFVLLIIIWLFSTTIVKPIKELNRKVHEVTGGNLEVHIECSSGGEVGELAAGLKNMLQSINQLISEVYLSKIVQKESELKALQAQINPHFLYNSLSLINWKAIRIQAHDISHVTTSLSTFYRTVLNKGKNLISVQDEISNTQAYVQIQLEMHDHSFDVVYDIDDKGYDYMMINNILQPVVENAIEHGIDHKEDGKGILKITAVCIDKGIEFIVEDNGPGIDESLIDDIMCSENTGYGLKNVHERLKLFFGDAYGISIHKNVVCGARISVFIPYYSQDRNKEAHHE